MSNMNICFITGHFPLSNHYNSPENGAVFGGVEKAVYEIAKRLAKNNNVSIISTKVYDNEPDYTEIDGLKIYKVPVWFRFFRSPFSPGLIWKILSVDSDVNIITATYPMFSDLAVVISKIKGIKTILNYHFDGKAYGVFGELFTWLYYKTFGRFMSLADKFIATSKDYAKNSVFLKGKNVEVVPNGVDVDFFKPNRRLKVRKKILFTGRLIKYKGLEYLIKAMKIVVDTVPDARLTITGDGPLKKEITDLVKKLRLQKNIKLIGHVNKKQLLIEYQSSEIFVLPSVNTNEAFGITILEAMACGLRVITTDLPGLRGTAKFGEIVQPRNVERLAEAMIGLLKDEKVRDETSRKSIGLVNKRYSWDEVTEQLEKKLRVEKYE